MNKNSEGRIEANKRSEKLVETILSFEKKRAKLNEPNHTKGRADGTHDTVPSIIHDGRTQAPKSVNSTEVVTR